MESQSTIDAMPRSVQAILNQGSSAYATPSGPMLALLSDLATEGNLAGLARAFMVFARALPGSAAFVAAAVPAKVLNCYLLRRRGIEAAAFLRWKGLNPDWAGKIIRVLRDPVDFSRVVEDMIREMEE